MATIGLLNNQANWLQNEIDVVQDLVDENIQATGVDLRYLPKEQLNLNEMFGESTISSFKVGFDIEMYIYRISNFNGDNDIFSKFGMGHTDEATLLVSVRRFDIEGSAFGLKQPIEGDLVYMDFSKTLWKIRKVKHDEEYFQFGQNRVWRLEASLYDPSHETFQENLTEPSELNQKSEPVDESGLSMLLGVSEESPQEESSIFEREYEETSAPNDFDSSDPFGGA